MKTLLGQLL